MHDLNGRVAIITGAAGNLGRAVALAFAKAGARTALVDHETGRLEKLAAGASGRPERRTFESVDMTDAGAVERMTRETVDHFGRLDILVNTVGGFRGGDPVEKEALETWDFLLGINLRTALIGCRTVAPYLREQGGGRIINVAAKAALSGPGNYAAYGAAKSAVVRLTESLSEELKRDGITVNSVLPGTIDTPQNRKAMPKADFRSWVPPEAIADVITFLASDAARAVTGAAIPVYGRG